MTTENDRYQSFEDSLAKEGQSQIRTKFAKDVKVLSELVPNKAFWAILFDWALILATFWVVHNFFNLAVYIAGIFIIAGRQHAFFVMVHEGAHRLIHSNIRLNDFISDIFCAFPLFVRTEAYRYHHGRHHQYLNSDKDPDWARKIVNADWSFPQNKGQFFKRNCLKYLFGYGVLEIILFMYVLGNLGTKNRKIKFASRTAYYLCIGAILSYFSFWEEFLLYWLVPYAFVLPFLNRIRSIAEHFALEYKNVFSHSRNVYPTWLDRLFFAPHNVCLHLDHHLFPAVAFYNLPKLHKKLLEDDEYKKSAHINQGYLHWNKSSLLKDIIAKNASQKQSDHINEAA